MKRYIKSAKRNLAETLMEIVEPYVSSPVLYYYMDKNDFVLDYEQNLENVEYEANKLLDVLEAYGFSIVDWDSAGHNVIWFTLDI